jgi:hypothetical protein
LILFDGDIYCHSIILSKAGQADLAVNYSQLGNQGEDMMLRDLLFENDSPLIK